ncbi:uncharacterized protein P174DRAFT_384989 [Aspergillus novofumigatus IBT 16806]|uniref:Uncharacterized protein n=1 Tax=Aspergillus novofumigatus (strain IBT 16806) TaxID=1392255 RepID=A0A2I1CHW9_ASPN1|nr:uncharacterized protein P174DRAFT_384989 [Aspergillus novofumigatus IBT 16806]PKX97203.1 hypothetical protein P174DRAFT_384989 [Aspergillus novofumigatus IBT 16806]
MPALATVIAVAAVCAALFIVSAVVGTLVWIKARRERRSRKAVCDRQGRYARQLRAFEADTATSLSREEGSALRLYGQLPYGKPTEWGVLASRESLTYSTVDSETSSQLAEKARSLGRSLSRSKSTRQLKGLLKSRPPGPLAPLAEAAERPCDKGPRYRARDPVAVSAVEGALELPTEMTPRQTPEKEEERSLAEPSIRPLSAVMPSVHRRERSGNLFPVMEDHHEGFELPFTRVRGGSITTQTAGAIPEQPVPPPPSAYPPNRFRLSKNDSMRFSSLSLETADSSILDDSRRTSTAIESDFTSPALPPCPTFTPFSANDVGRMEFERRSFAASNSAYPAPFIFPATSPAGDSLRLEPNRTSPRRSLTARSPSQTERVSPPPRRSESLCSNQSRREVTSMPHLDPNMAPHLSATGYSGSLLPYFSQLHRHSMYASRRTDGDPFYGGQASSHVSIHPPRAPARRVSSLYVPEISTQVRSENAPKPPLTSAMKNTQGHRKGHRRQNCVRISIHPPITFGRPAFSPMAEEPEELEDLSVRRPEAQAPRPTSYGIPSMNSSVVTFSANRNNSYDFQRPRPRVTDVFSTPDGSPTKKRKHSRADSGDDFLSPAGSDKTLPEIMTSLPSSNDGSLSQTPSPEKNAPLWLLPIHASSPTSRENASPQTSPRRSAVKGPRTLPIKMVYNNSPRSAVPLEENDTLSIQQPSSSNRPLSLRPCGSSKDVATATDPLPHDESSAAVLDSTSLEQQGQEDLSCDVHRTPSTCNGNMVTIWEDNDTERKAQRIAPPTQSNDSGSCLKKFVPEGCQQTTTDDRTPHKSSQKAPKKGIMTPTGKTIGLGIGAATPGSLYDGDGFLKE